MTKILRKAYIKYGVQKTNRVITAIVTGLSVISILATVNVAYHAGYINGKQDVTDYLLSPNHSRNL